MATVNNSGLVAHWLMDEIVDGQVADQMGSYPLSVSSGMNQSVSVTDGRFNKAIFIDKADQMIVTLPSMPQWTLIGWARPISFDEYGHLFSVLNNQLKFLIKVGNSSFNGGLLYAYATGEPASVVSGLNLALNVWNHYAITYDGTAIRFYVNTVEGIPAESANFGIPADTYVIGANLVSDVVVEDIQWFHDQRRLYNRALPLTEIIEHYNEESPYYIDGTIREDGLPQPRKVRLYSAESGNLLQEVTADVNGEYAFQLFEDSDKFVMAVPEAGRRPLVHGPVRAKQR